METAKYAIRTVDESREEGSGSKQQTRGKLFEDAKLDEHKMKQILHPEVHLPELRPQGVITRLRRHPVQVQGGVLWRKRSAETEHAGEGAGERRLQRERKGRHLHIGAVDQER